MPDERRRSPAEELAERGYFPDGTPMPRPRGTRKRRPKGVNPVVLYGGMAAGAVALVVITVLLYYGLKRDPYGPFKEQEIRAFATGPVKPGNGRPRGKVVVVNEATSELDDVHGKLSFALQAQSAAEVGTIVRLRWNKEQVGWYDGGSPAYKYSATATFIDKETSAVILTKTFQGDDPPKRIRRGESEGNGGKPTHDVANYIETMVGK